MRPISWIFCRLSSILILLCLVPAAAVAQVQRGAGLPVPLPLFPPDNPWNVDISAAPVDTAHNAGYIGFIGTNRPLHPDFGGDVDPTDPTNPNIYGMVYITVSGTQPLVPVTFVLYDDQSDHGAPGRPVGYPIPDAAKTGTKWIEGGPDATVDTGDDRHMLLVDRDNRLLFELYQAFWNTTLNRWEAGSGAVFPLDSNQRRPDTWTSADAAGLAILPGLIRYDEAFGTVPIKHAFRMTVRDSNDYVFPASHHAGSNPSAPPMGTRLRLKASKDISGFTPEVQRIFQAMKTYGLIVADNGSDMYIQGTYDTRWNNDVLNPAFGSLHASDFEVIQLGWQPSAPPTGALDFYTLTPCRLLDTRNAPGPHGGPALAPSSQRVLPVAGTCGIPAGAKALALNVTVVSPPGSGYVTLFPGDSTPAVASSINFSAAQILSNNTVAKLAASGSGTLGLVSLSTAGPVQVVLDVTGYFQ